MPKIPATDNICMLAGIKDVVPFTLWGDGRLEFHDGATADKLRDLAISIRERSALMCADDAWNEIIRAALLDMAARVIDMQAGRTERLYTFADWARDNSASAI